MKLATLICLVGIWCASIVSRTTGAEVTKQYPGVTQQLAQGYGTVIAGHLGLSGSWFYYIYPDDKVEVTYEDGTKETFIVTSVDKYQVVGDFLRSLDNEKLYQPIQIYDKYGKSLMMITCVQSTDMSNPTWGRLIISAKPYSEKLKTSK